MRCELMSDAVCCYNGIVMKRFEVSLEGQGGRGVQERIAIYWEPAEE